MTTRSLTAVLALTATIVSHSSAENVLFDREDLLLDHSIRDWVVFPIIVMVSGREQQSSSLSS